MSRREYASSEVYSEHDREYRPSRRHGGRTAELEEVEIHERRRNAEPEFLRPDYGRSTDTGALIVREREKSRERPRRRDRDVEETEEVVIRERSRNRPRRQEVLEDEVIVDRGPRRRDREEVREEVVYRERERDPPPPPIRTEREEFEYYRERDGDRDPIPYRGPPAPMVPVQPVRSEREVFEYRPVIREPTPEPEQERTEITIKEKSRERPRYREDEEIVIRERSRERPRYREEKDEEILIREKERERPRYREERDEEIIIRRDERSRERPRYREERDEEIIIREKERDRPRYREERDEEIIIRDRERERARPREDTETLTTRHDEGRTRARSRGGYEETDALIIRKDDRSRAGSRGNYREEDISIRERDRERYRERSRSRERDDIIFRHEDRGGRHNDELIIRRHERSPSPEPVREPSPVRAPPIVQEVITHHRHIDHGFERSEPPRRRSPSPEREERIEIRHRGTSHGRQYDDDIIFERERGGRPRLDGVHRGRTEEDLALIRTSDREPVGPPVRYEAREPRRDRLWTEITKDLVAEEAIREKGYEWEEAETSWFVMQHLRYDDVLELVELTEDIRADRRDRISEMQAERERGPYRRGGQPPWDEERIIEREVVYEGGGRPRRTR